jgi:DNA polymerase I-like protein with 3'-5' exonuclease and polymerase domains
MRTYQYDDIQIRVNELPPQSDQPVALDTEFFGQELGKLHRPHGRFASLACTLDARTVYIITDGNLIEPFMSRLDGVHIWHNALYDITQLRAYFDYQERTKIWDTMLVEQIRFSGYYYSNSLADLSRRYCNLYVDKGVREDFSTATEMDNDKLFYAAVDVCALWEVAHAQLEEIDDEDLEVWKAIERDFLWTLASTDGVPFDADGWMARYERDVAEVERLNDELPFNPRSHQQVKAFFKEKYNIKLDGTAVDVLTDTLHKHPECVEIEDILRNRTLTKMASTYGDKWVIASENGRVYPAWKQMGAATGRMSADGDIVIQTVPHSADYREHFRAPDGYVMIIADYSTQEPKILTELANDVAMKEFFRQGKDIYIGVGSKVFHEEFDKHDIRRKRMKKIVLGVSYGMSKYTLATELDITPDEAQELLDAFFDAFPDIANYVSECARWKPYVTTLMGRKYWGNKFKSGWERNYQNSPIQGSAADTTKVAANRIRKELGYNPFVIYMHDELVAVVPEEDKDYAAAVIKSNMITAQEELHPDIPGGIEIFIGRNWSAKE